VNERREIGDMIKPMRKIEIERLTRDDGELRWQIITTMRRGWPTEEWGRWDENVERV